MTTRVGSWILFVFYGILRLIVIAGTLLWRLAAALLVTLWGLLVTAWNNKLIVGIFVILFGGGLAMQLFQEEIQTGIDQTYECGVYPSAEFIANAFPLPIIRIPWEEASVFYNNLALLLFDGIDNIFGDLRTLQRAQQISTVKGGVLSIVTMFIRSPFGGGFDDSWDTFAAGFIDYFIGIWDAIKDIVAWAVRFATSIIQLDFFNLSCSLCAADPDADCQLREPWLINTPDYDCDECHEHTADLFGLIGSLLDAIFGARVSAWSNNTSFRRIFRAIGCVFRSIYMIPIQMVEASAESPMCVDDIFLDIYNPIPVVSPDDPNDSSMLVKWFLGGDALTFPDCGGADGKSCCGKPSGCSFPTNSGDDLPVGLVPCIGEVFLALTDDEIDDWLLFFLSFVMPIVHDVVITFDRTVECFSGTGDSEGLQMCFDNYPANAANTNPGVCRYDDSDVLPDNGIYACFDIIYTCIETNVTTKAPLMEPLIDSGILKFFLNDLWRGTVDFAVCPFVTLGVCMDTHIQESASDPENPTLSDFIGALDNLQFCSPVWYDILGWFIEFLNWINGVITGINSLITDLTNTINALASSVSDAIQVVSCVGKCGAGEVVNGEFFECFTSSDTNGDDNSDGCDDELPRNTARDYARARATHNFDALPAIDENSTVLSQWTTMLRTRARVPEDSVCGHALYACLPSTANLMGWGDRSIYMACIGIYGVRLAYTQGCLNQSDVSYDMANSSASDALREVFHIRSNCGDGILTQHDIVNATMPTASPFTSINRTRVSTWVNASSWNFVPEFISKVYEQVKTTRVYGRTVDMYESYNARVKSSGTQGVNMSAELQADLDAIYTDYANDILSLYHRRAFRNETLSTENTTVYANGQYVSAITGKLTSYATPTTLRSTYDGGIAQMVKIGVLEPDPQTPTQIRASQDAAMAGIPQSTLDTWNVVNDALHIEYAPWFQGVAGLVHAARTRDGPNIAGILSGRRKFHATRGEFMPAAKFRAETRAAGGQTQPSIVRAVVGSGTVQSRLPSMLRGWGTNAAAGWDPRKPRVYSPFPIPRNPDVNGSDWYNLQAGSTWRIEAMDRLAGTHAKYAARRALRLAEIAKREGKATNDFDANQILYDALDWFIGLFGIGGPQGLFNGLVDNTVAFWMTFSLRDFTEETAQEKIEQFFQCSIPENIDGTSLHSPLCFGLMREDAFAIFSAVTATEGQFPTQIQWPEELIVQDCVTTYSGAGADDVFAFEFSNNCALDLAQVETSTCAAGGSCAGTLDLQAAEVSAYRDVIEYRLKQTGGTCAVTSVSFLVPNCANVVSVTDVNVTGFDSGPAVGSGCAPGLPAGLPSSDVMRVDLSFALNDVTAFNVTFDTSVAFAPAASTVAVTANGEATCHNCSLTLPVATCINAQTSSALHDPWRELRPFCDLPQPNQCDYCEREYRSCASAGFADVLDTFLYITGAAPIVLDDGLFGGVDVKQFELWFGPAVAVYGIILSFFLIVTIVCIPVAFFTTAIVGNILHIVTWAMFVFIGDLVPYPVIFFMTTLYFQFRQPQWYELLIWFFILFVSPGLQFLARIIMLAIIMTAYIPVMKKFLKPLIIVSSALFALWLLTLVFNFPKLQDVLNINQGFMAVLQWLDDSVFFGIIIDTKPLMARVSKFLYPTGTLPSDLQTFCFWWNLGNLALIGLLFLFAAYPLLLLFRWLLPPILALFNVIVLALDLRRRAIFIGVREQAETAEDNSKANRTRFQRLRDAVRDKFSRTKAAFVGGRTRGLPPGKALSPTAQQKFLSLSPKPDESHAAFQQRRAEFVHKVMAEDHASDDENASSFAPPPPQPRDNGGAGVAASRAAPTVSVAVNVESIDAAESESQSDSESDSYADSGPDGRSVEPAVVSNRRTTAPILTLRARPSSNR